MSVLDKNVKQVSGPYNVVRMEGKINGIEKVVHIFFDMHASLTAQSECDNVFSKSIQNFLADSFDSLNDTDKMYDFFLEIRPDEIQNVKSGWDFPININWLDTYLAQVWKLFRKLFVYDVEKNLVSVSDYFKNVRLHYMDIRNYIGNFVWYKIRELQITADSMVHREAVELDRLDYIIDGIKEIVEYYHTVINIIRMYRGNKKNPKKFPTIKYLYPVNGKMDEALEDRPLNERLPTPTEQKIIDMENMYYLVHKIFSVYNHPAVKKILYKQLSLWEKDIKELIKYAEEIITKFEKIGNYIYQSRERLVADEKSYIKYIYGPGLITTKEMLLEIFRELTMLHDKHVYSFTRIMDVYFLRRFLDKDYITNAITYTGGYHSSSYVQILSRDFNFRITHVSYSEVSLDILNDRVKKWDIQDIIGLFLPPTPNQCSNITHFPKNYA